MVKSAEQGTRGQVGEAVIVEVGLQAAHRLSRRRGAADRGRPDQGRQRQNNNDRQPPHRNHLPPSGALRPPRPTGRQRQPRPFGTRDRSWSAANQAREQECTSLRIWAVGGSNPWRRASASCCGPELWALLSGCSVVVDLVVPDSGCQRQGAASEVATRDVLALHGRLCRQSLGTANEVSAHWG